MGTKNPGIHTIGLTALDQQPDIPGLSLSDFSLFPKLKEHLRCHLLLEDDEVQTAVKTWLSRQDAKLCRDGPHLNHGGSVRTAEVITLKVIL